MTGTVGLFRQVPIRIYEDVTSQAHRRCHCGRVRFEVEAPAQIEVTDCTLDCSKSGYLHLIVKKAQFRLVSGAGR